MEDLISLFTVFLVVIFILYLSFISTKFVGEKAMSQRVSKHMKVLDTLMLSQENSLVIVEVSGKIQLMSMGTNGIHYIKELETLETLEKEENVPDSFKDNFQKSIKEKFFRR